MTPRLPYLAVVAVVGAVVSTSVGGVTEGARPSLAPVPEPVARLTAPAVAPGGSPGSTWYCAGGETVVLANVTDEPVAGTLAVYPGELAAPPRPTGEGSGPAGDAAASSATPAAAVEQVEHGVTVPAHDRLRVDLAGILPPADGSDAAPRASVVELDGGGVAVEQEIDHGGASEVAPCASATAPEWHFAWGQTTRDARELLVLFNPFLSDTVVDGVFAIDGGVREPVRWQGLVVPARRALVVDVGQDVTRRQHVSATVRSRGGGLVVSRVQSFDGSGGVAGSSLALGQPDPAAMWTFPYGEVGDRVGERIVLYNPGDAVAEVDVTAAGAQPFGVVVRPGRFEAVDYTVEDRVARDQPHATTVRSRNGVPVVAERVLTATGGEVTAGPGSPATRHAWMVSAVPRSESGEGDEARLAVVNPDPSRPARVWVTVEQGGVRTQPADLQGVEVGPEGRADLRLPPEAGTVAVLLQSDAPVVVDRVVVRDGRITSVAPALPIG